MVSKRTKQIIEELARGLVKKKIDHTRQCEKEVVEVSMLSILESKRRL